MMERIIERIQQLAPRERIFLLIGLAVAFVLILYAFILDPFFSQLNDLKKEIADNRDTLYWLQHANEQIQQLSKQKIFLPKPISPESFLVTVNNSLQENNINNFIGQINQNADEIHVRFNEVPFDPFIQWLTVIWQKYRITTNSLSLTPTNQEGIVTIDMTLKLSGAS